jgi:hypothetical protein
MRLVLAVVAAVLLLAPAAGAYPLPVQSGHYVGTAQDRNNVHHSISFDVDYGEKLIKNFHFAGHNLGKAPMTIRKGVSGDEWLFAATSPGPPERRFAGSPTGPSSFSGDVIENPSGSRDFFYFRAHKS